MPETAPVRPLEGGLWADRFGRDKTRPQFCLISAHTVAVLVSLETDDRLGAAFAEGVPLGPSPSVQVVGIPVGIPGKS
jgi:hypothetical protein